MKRFIRTYKMPATILEDFIGGIALVVICLGVPFIWAVLT